MIRKTVGHTSWGGHTFFASSSSSCSPGWVPDGCMCMLVCGVHACVSKSQTVSQKWQEEAPGKPRCSGRADLSLSSLSALMLGRSQVLSELSAEPPSHPWLPLAARNQASSAMGYSLMNPISITAQRPLFIETSLQRRLRQSWEEPILFPRIGKG